MIENRNISRKLFIICIVSSTFWSGNVYAHHLQSAGEGNVIYQAMEIFPLVNEHVHGPTVVELPNGDLLAAWFQGTGERWADDVRIMGARLRAGSARWGNPFLMADVPGFPDINPILFLDPQERLWLMWYTVIANQWETSLPRYRISDNYMKTTGPPQWSWQDTLFVKPGDLAQRGIQPGDRFVKSVESQLDSYGKYLEEISRGTDRQISGRITERYQAWRKELLDKAAGRDMIRRGYLYDENGGRRDEQLGYPYFRRMGWQTKNKAVVIDNKRIIVPLYSDGFSFSLMALTDDLGKTWQFSNPLVAPGNIQPSIAIKADGALVAYMRDNGPPPQRLHVSTSNDKGLTWSPVRDSGLLNPGSGADLVTLPNGHWVLAYNDTEDGRHSLAVSISTNDGKTWDHTCHLELDSREQNLATRSHYPSIIVGRDDTIHVVYSFHHNDRQDAAHKTIKYARFNETWINQKPATDN